MKEVSSYDVAPALILTYWPYDFSYRLLVHLGTSPLSPVEYISRQCTVATEHTHSGQGELPKFITIIPDERHNKTRAPHAGADAHLNFTSIMGHYFISRNTSNDEIQVFRLT